MQTTKKTSKFLKVKCKSCQNEQIIFSHAKTVVKCQICGEVLAEPAGGKALLRNLAGVNILS